MYISLQNSFAIVEAHGFYVKTGKILDLPKDKDGLRELENLKNEFVDLDETIKATEQDIHAELEFQRATKRKNLTIITMDFRIDKEEVM